MLLVRSLRIAGCLGAYMLFFFTDITWNNQTAVAAEFQIIAAGALQAHLSI